MNDTPDRATEPAEQDGAAPRVGRRELREARRELSRAERRVEARRAEIETLSAQVDVLGMEAKTPTQRQASGPAEPADLETDRGIASFALSARMHRRHNTTGVHRSNKLREPILDLYAKTSGRAFAEAHGVQVPAVLGSWPTPDDIDWDSLPQRFVIKSSRGGGGINVFPVERRGGALFDFIAQRVVTSEKITEKFWKKHQGDSVYFAEEFLLDRAGKKMPDDIKVFCFYGEPAYIEVRTEDWSRKRDGRQRVRTFLKDGTELFDVRALIPYGDDITTPVDFDTIAEVSGKLSAAIRRPIQRLDFYETEHGIVFGEVTQNPGRPPSLVAAWDRRFGDTYEEAAARLFSDLAAEGALGLEYGDADTEA